MNTEQSKENYLLSIPDQNAANIEAISKWLWKSIDFLVVSTGHSEGHVKSICMSIVTYITEKGTDELKQVTPRSVVGVARDLLLCGLDINTKGHAYITSYRETYKDPNSGKSQYTGKHLAKLDISYKGYVFMLNVAFPDCVIKSFLIWEKDTWLWEEENQQVRYRYLPHPENRMRSDYINIQGVAVFIEYTKNGRVVSAIEELPIDVLKKIRSKAKTQAVWNEWFDQQAKKSAIRRLLKIHLSGVTDQLHSLVDIENEGFDVGAVSGQLQIEGKQSAAMSMLEQEVAGEKPTPALLEKQEVVNVTPIASDEDDEAPELNETFFKEAKTLEEMPLDAQQAVASTQHKKKHIEADTLPAAQQSHEANPAPDIHVVSKAQEDDIPAYMLEEVLYEDVTLPSSAQKTESIPPKSDALMYAGDLIGVDAGEYTSLPVDHVFELFCKTFKGIPEEQYRMDLLEANEEFTTFLVKHKQIDMISALHKAVHGG